MSGFFSGSEYSASEDIEVFVNPLNPEWFSRVWRAHQSGSSNAQLTSYPTSSVLTVSESAYYYGNSDTK